MEKPRPDLTKLVSLCAGDAGPEPRTPRGYQQLAWQEMDRRFGSGAGQMMLRLPTGAGKTYTAVRWLCSRPLPAGRRVLWAVHRTRLMTQAAEDFVKQAGLLPGGVRVPMLVASGSADHCEVAPDTLAEAQLLICGMHQLYDAAIVEWLQGGTQRPVVVIDEAHRAYAATYREFLWRVELAGAFDLLGLSATPTRTLQSERGGLRAIFGDPVVPPGSTMPELVAAGYLAKPIYSMIAATNFRRHPAIQAVERTIGGGLMPELARRIWEETHLTTRVVQDYLARHRGKLALFFVPLQDHALDIEEKLRHEGVRAAAVISDRPNKDNETAQEEFGKPEGHEVLISVNLLAEGVDFPLCEVVYLARHTTSRILFQQMVGRALRPDTEVARIVQVQYDPGEHWATLLDVFDPSHDKVELEGPEVRRFVQRTRVARAYDGDLPPVADVALLELILRALGAPGPEDAAVVGWYLLPEAGDKTPERALMVLEGQRPYWQQIAAAAVEGRRELAELREPLRPRPSDDLFDAFCHAARAIGGEPTWFDLDTCTRSISLAVPGAAARWLLQQGVRRSEEVALLRHEVIAAAPWKDRVDLDAYTTRVVALVDELAAQDPIEDARRTLDLSTLPRPAELAAVEGGRLERLALAVLRDAGVVPGRRCGWQSQGIAELDFSPVNSRAQAEYGGAVCIDRQGLVWMAYNWGSLYTRPIAGGETTTHDARGYGSDEHGLAVRSDGTAWVRWGAEPRWHGVSGLRACDLRSIRAAVWSPDGRALALLHDDQVVVFTFGETVSGRQTIQMSGVVHASFSGDSTCLFLSVGSREVHGLALRSGHVHAREIDGWGTRALAPGPGASVLCATADQLWRISTAHARRVAPYFTLPALQRILVAPSAGLALLCSTGMTYAFDVLEERGVPIRWDIRSGRSLLAISRDGRYAINSSGRRHELTIRTEGSA